MPPSITPQQFVHKWRNIALKERSAYQQHFLDLCLLVGHPTPAQVDRKGEWFTFEAGASKQASGGQGWADVWKRGFFGWEYKGTHANLEKAYGQLLQYRESLQNPPLLVVSDLQRIVIHTNFTNTVKRTYELELDELLIPDRLDILRAVFNEPERLRAPQTPEQVTRQAAQDFARLADILRRWGEDPHRTAHYLIRLLFCLFAEDIGLLPRGLFTKLVQQTGDTTSDYTDRIGQLFSIMATGGWFGVERIPFFDGGLFDDGFALDLPSDGIEILIDVARLDWSGIEPSILGTLFERSLDPDKRSQLGTHYTGREDILLIVEPVLMEPLRRRWADIRNQAEDLARKDKVSEVFHLLDGFDQEIAGIQVLDPACGSGNFLYVALRRLLDLEKEVITVCRDLGAGELHPRISPQQLHGIEIDPYAHELAEATVWIGYIQWLRENGFGLPSEPILKPLDTILQMDAILAYDEDGTYIEPEWPKANFIIGNPPFLGDKKMRTELGSRYVDDLRALYRDRLPGQSDLVCYWFEKSRMLIEQGTASRAGLLATQGIRGGANRIVLERIKRSGDIFWAQSDRNWVLAGATVHVSMVAFDDGKETLRKLDGERVTHINSDLTSSVDLTQAEQLNENGGIAFIGTQKTGAFDLTHRQAQQMLEDKGNPHGRPNSDVVKPWINATDITRRPRNMWIIDFGPNMSIEEAAQYQRPFEYVRQNVKPKRENVRRKNHRENWWLFGEPRPGMREAINGLDRYIVTPLVSKYRTFNWQPTHVIPENLLVVIARDDDYFIGVLQSKVHELWSRRQGTQLREASSGQRYTLTSTFETFPFPWPPSHEPQEDPRVRSVAEAARELIAKRDAWLNPPSTAEKELKNRTLTNLYNEYPTWLEFAHHKLDHAVLDSYGWHHNISDETILERLLKLNLQRARK